ncbi:transposase [Neisseriaceae bacterium TC5R-5]|nr:transposase [Neisseriaceae bacterium TC5R-5]
MTKPAPKRYRTTNWNAYNQALIQRGSLSVWLETNMSWQAAPQGKRGRTQTYSDAAIQFCLTITRKNARPWKGISLGLLARNEILRATKRLGRTIWKRWSDYHRRSLVETKMHCFKRLGERVMARCFNGQVAELQVRAAILNRFSMLGRPCTVAVA